VRKADGRVRITAELIEASDRTIWGSIASTVHSKEVFDLQDKVSDQHRR
jgi:TolB-like protein